MSAMELTRHDTLTGDVTDEPLQLHFRFVQKENPSQSLHDLVVEGLPPVQVLHAAVCKSRKWEECELFNGDTGEALRTNDAVEALVAQWKVDEKARKVDVLEAALQASHSSSAADHAPAT